MTTCHILHKLLVGVFFYDEATERQQETEWASKKGKKRLQSCNLNNQSLVLYLNTPSFPVSKLKLGGNCHLFLIVFTHATRW